MSGLEIAAAAVLVAGVATSTVAAVQSANAQAKTVRFNSAVAARDLEIAAMLRDRERDARNVAILEEQQGLELDLRAFDRQRRRLQSSQLAVSAASGFEPTGSAVEIFADTAAELALEREQIELASKRRQRQIRDEGLLLGFEADRLLESAQLTREIGGFEARNLRTAGGLRAFSSLLGGGSTLITGLRSA